MTMSASARMVPGTLRSEVSLRDGRFRLVTEEPEEAGGEDSALMPHELLPAALAACVGTTLTMYARTKGWELGDVAVDVEYDPAVRPRRCTVEIRLGGDLSEEQRERLEKIAASCAVRRSIEGGIAFEERIAVGAAVS